MNVESINLLPMVTYRYLKTNDTKAPFQMPDHRALAQWSHRTYCEKGVELPRGFNGASPRWIEASLAGEQYTVRIPDGVETSLNLDLATSEIASDYAGAFVFELGRGSKLKLIWKWEGPAAKGVYALTAVYRLADEAELHVSQLQTGLEERILCSQRMVTLGRDAKAYFAAADLGGSFVIEHGRGYLEGDRSVMHESTLYAAAGTQELDLFYHVDHMGEESECDIDVKGSLSDRSKKTFRGTLDFKRGCSGSEGSEGDYAIQLDPETKNISLPLLLCTEDNVMGNHASSSGQMDPGTVYYLMTRGFSEQEARRIVVESMLRPLIDRMDESLQERVLQGIHRCLDQSMAHR